MREVSRTGGVIHSASTVGGGAGSTVTAPPTGLRTCSLNAESGGAHVTAPQGGRRS